MAKKGLVIDEAGEQFPEGIDKEIIESYLHGKVPRKNLRLRHSEAKFLVELIEKDMRMSRGGLFDLKYLFIRKELRDKLKKILEELR